MQRATVVRGVSVPATDPAELADWYATRLGVECEYAGSERHSAPPEHDTLPTFRLVPAESSDSSGGWSMTLSVADLPGMLRQLRDAGVEVGPQQHDSAGDYADLSDPEGHPIRLRVESQADAPPAARPHSSDDTAIRVLPGDGPVAEQPFRRAAREPRRWARWIPLALVLVAGLVAVLVIDPGSDPPERQGGASALPERPPPLTGANAVHGTDVGHPLFGISADWELYADVPGGVLRLELGAGEITNTPLPGLQADDTTKTVVTPAGALVRTRDSLSTYLVPDDGPAYELGKAGSSGLPFFPGPWEGTAWVLSGQGGRPGLAVIGPGTDGRELSVTIPAAGFTALVGDGRGHVLFDSVDGIYLTSPDGLRRVANGRLLAAGPTRLLTRECDEQAHCFDVVTDRETGHTRRLPASPVDRVGVVGSISPDGSTAAIVGPAEQYRSTLWAVDLRTGRRQPIAPMRAPYDGNKLAWSPDGQWLFAVSQGELVAFERDAFRPRHLEVPLPPVVHVVLRAAPGT